MLTAEQKDELWVLVDEPGRACNKVKNKCYKKQNLFLWERVSKHSKLSKMGKK